MGGVGGVGDAGAGTVAVAGVYAAGTLVKRGMCAP